MSDSRISINSHSLSTKEVPPLVSVVSLDLITVGIATK